MKRFVKDLEKCGQKKYNLVDKVDMLDWFVGGDSEKILKLQRKLNSSSLSINVIEDGVFGEQTEKAWVEYVREAMKIASMSNPARVKYAFDNCNFVVGYGGYISGHFMGGATGGASFGVSALPIDISGGVSNDGLILQFNPVEWLKENLKVNWR